VTGPAYRFRQRTISELVADALPAHGLFGALRRRFAPVFHRVLASRAAHLRCCLPHGESVSIAPEWRHITWNPEEYEAFRRAVRPGWTVIDAGANVGAYSMLFALWAGSEGAVYAFEPDPAAYEGLCRHIALNGLSGRVHPFPVALTDGADGRVALARHGSSGLSRLAPRSARTIDVDAVSVDDFCRSRGISPDLIKIDVEGAEDLILFPFFASAPESLWPSLLLIENSEHQWRRDCRDMLIEKGYRRREIPSRNLVYWRPAPSP
jgi:FkbM family methyltransferase